MKHKILESSNGLTRNEPGAKNWRKTQNGCLRRVLLDAVRLYNVADSYADHKDNIQIAHPITAMFRIQDE